MSGYLGMLPDIFEHIQPVNHSFFLQLFGFDFFAMDKSRKQKASIYDKNIIQYQLRPDPNFQCLANESMGFETSVRIPHICQGRQGRRPCKFFCPV